MAKQPEMPKSPEEILASKKEQLKNAVELMFNFQRQEKVKKNLFPQLDNLTSEEIDYCLTWVRYFDKQVQLRGPFTDTASQMLVEDEKKLKEIEEKIGPDRARELKGLLE